MPEKEKFDLKDILLIVLSCLLIVAVIALSVSFSSYAILSQHYNKYDFNTSEACIASESLEREKEIKEYKESNTNKEVKEKNECK